MDLSARFSLFDTAGVDDSEIVGGSKADLPILIGGMFSLIDSQGWRHVSNGGAATGKQEQCGQDQEPREMCALKAHRPKLVSGGMSHGRDQSMFLWSSGLLSRLYR